MQCANIPTSADSQVKNFYQKMEVECSSNDLYLDAWGLRKLYGYAHRRQADSAKRGQVPKDSKLNHGSCTGRLPHV